MYHMFLYNINSCTSVCCQTTKDTYENKTVIDYLNLNLCDSRESSHIRNLFTLTISEVAKLNFL